MLERVEDIDLGYSRDCLDKFLRVRVNIDISKPLRRALNVGVEDSDQMATISVCYDRLPDLCFHCGVLSHPLREWPLRKSIEDVGRPLKYGAWIRAGTTLVLRVLGYELEMDSDDGRLAAMMKIDGGGDVLKMGVCWSFDVWD
ncbi:hypothetical protein EZV62_006889 [Acer yangbiense]|uniref:Zinc knuckle CX2CX4HX4C domain-containing protein n=1 Tax=Acer yangbiense TaxID=1000413 RepID=A0A5C7I8Y8_9ROSI|nr:hypothetical protein EZV62_006889 [Acer yangbiense]